MNYVIGIDGGGTKTRCVAMDRRMNLLWEGRGGSSNLNSLPREEVEQNLAQLLESLFQGSGLSREDCACLCLGTAGAGRESVREELKDLLEQRLEGASILVTDDAQSTLRGATADGWGILLIGGTGSICFARNRRGQTCRVGGWGHIAGDEGSGYDMGCQILRAVVRQADGRGPKTLLTDLVMDAWSLQGVDQLIDTLYRSGKGKTEIAALAILCDVAYDKEDKTAFQIMENCAVSLAEMAETAARLFPEKGTVPCVCSGSLLEKSRYLKFHLRRQLEWKRPQIRITTSLHDAAWGCARLAWDHVKQPSKEVTHGRNPCKTQ